MRRIGIAGVGRIGAMHAANLVAIGGVDQVLLYDPMPGRAAEAAAVLGGQAVAVVTLDELFAADGVVVATPTDTHPAVVRHAIAAGVPVLCEKPLASAASAIEELVPEIEAAGACVLVGFQRRFDPATVELRRRIQDGAAGSVYLVRAVCNDRLPPSPEFIATSGGLFKDCLIHDLDAVPWLVGEPVAEVYATGSVLVDKAFAEIGDVDNAVVTLRFAGGAHAVLSASRRNPAGYDCRIEVFGSRDTLAAGYSERTPVRSLEPGVASPVAPWPGFPERFLDAYRNELSVFLSVIDGTAENPSPARESLISARLAEACERSVRTRLPVRVEQRREVLR